MASSAIGVTEPNPRVGCVIGTNSGIVLGRGPTQQAGGPHAEVMALRDASAQGHDVRGATAWVTLEPCAHHGRTPPCCDALIAAGLARVVVALQDPFPQVAGAGILRMRAAGMQVEWADDDIASAAWELNLGFFSRVTRNRPWVRVKVAASMDGRTALQNGESQWITGEAARADGHAWRKRASAVLTGIGTILADNPRLDVRLVPAHSYPLRVVVDSALRTPASSLVAAPPGKVLLVTALPPQKIASTWQSRENVEIVSLPNAEGRRVDLQSLMHLLASKGVNELHVEAGETLNGALANAGLVDEWLVYLAPKFLGTGRGMVALRNVSSLEQALTLKVFDISSVGTDIRIRLRRSGQGFSFQSSKGLLALIPD